MGFARDVAANLTADLLALAFVYAAGLRLLNRFAEHAATRRVFIVVEASMDNFDPSGPQGPPQRLRITNLSDQPFYDCCAVVRDHDTIPQPFASATMPLMYDTPLNPGETTYSDWFTVQDGKVFDAVTVQFWAVSGVKYECSAVGSRPARVRAARVSPWAALKRSARRRVR